jgi:hypothetical protein
LHRRRKKNSKSFLWNLYVLQNSYLDQFIR